MHFLVRLFWYLSQWSGLICSIFCNRLYSKDIHCGTRRSCQNIFQILWPSQRTQTFLLLFRLALAILWTINVCYCCCKVFVSWSLSTTLSFCGQTEAREVFSKVEYPKYFKHWYYMAAIMDCGCSGILNNDLNHGSFLSLLKFFGWKIHS